MIIHVEDRQILIMNIEVPKISQLITYCWQEGDTEPVCVSDMELGDFIEEQLPSSVVDEMEQLKLFAELLGIDLEEDV